MKIELKNIKISQFASEETICFQATVYINGVKRGTVNNQGYGGPNNYSDRSLYAELKAYGLTLPKVHHYGMNLEISPDLLINEVLTDYQNRKDLIRLLKSRCLFIKNGKLMEYRKAKTPNELAYHIGLAYNNGHAVLNEMTFEEAFKVYMDATAPKATATGGAL